MGPDSAPLTASWVVLALLGQCLRSVGNRAQDPETLVMDAEASRQVFNTPDDIVPVLLCFLVKI